jgi:hypothetical protein
MSCVVRAGGAGVAGGARDLKIVDAPRGDMDSNDGRITALPSSASVGGRYASETP